MINKTKAIVLKKMDFRETSLICTFLTQEFGKVKGILKGIRNDSNKFASSVEPFSVNEIIYYPVKTSDLHLVSAAELEENFTNIRNDLNLMNIATYVLDLADSLLAVEDKNIDIYNLLFKSLNALNNRKDASKIQTIFQIRSLFYSGFKPHLDSCVSCSNSLDFKVKFSNAYGGLLCNKCMQKDKQARGIFRGTIATIMHIERNNFDSLMSMGLHPEIKKELKTILSNFIEFHLEKRLKTQKVINQIDKRINEAVKL